MEQAELTRPWVNNHICKVCSHPDRDKIHEALARGAPVLDVSLHYAEDFSRKTLHRHVLECTSIKNTKDQSLRLKQESQLDLTNRLSVTLSECEEALVAAKRVLLVDGDLCFDPRAWEISVVYADHNDCNQETHEPKIKTAKLSKLLSLIAEAGYEPQHSFIKSEDMRKTFRDCVAQLTDTIAAIAKITGIYTHVDKQQEQLDYLRALVTKAAAKYGTSYEYELSIFLENHAQGLRPDLRGMLQKECLQSTPLAPGGAGVKSLPPSPDSSPRLSEPNGRDGHKNSGKIFAGTIEVE